jgi:zinc transporter ZupT
MTITIILHELPQEISDFALFVEAGLPPWKALIINGAVSLSGFFGAIIAIGVGSQFSHDVLKVLPFAGGLFLYLGLTYFQEVPKNWRTIAAFSAGIGLMALMLLAPHEHAEAGGHEGHDH